MQDESTPVQETGITLTQPRDTTIRFYKQGMIEVARIDENGIFRCTVDPTDENAKAFIDCIERVTGRIFTGIEPRQLQMEKPEVTEREDGTFDVRYRFAYRPFDFTKEGK